MKTNIIINEEVVKPGERTTIMLPMPKLYDWTPMSMPVHVINGEKSGPRGDGVGREGRLTKENSVKCSTDVGKVCSNFATCADM